MTDTLRRLQARSRPSESGRLSALQVSYAMALRNAEHRRLVAPLGHALSEAQAFGARSLNDLDSRGGATRTSLEDIGLGAMGLIAAANLFWLLRLGLARLKKPGEWDGRDRRVEELQAQALTDSLTQLGNHRAFHADLSTELNRRATTGAHFTLMAIDLDGLKHINDTRGHPAGDAHIKSMTRCLRTVVGIDGAIYRTGGDEFMVILPSKRNWDALLLANKVDEATRRVFGARAVSIGLAESTGLEGRQLLILQADLALYESKRMKLRAVTYRPDLVAQPRSASASPAWPRRASSVLTPQHSPLGETNGSR